jgi:lipopolysaccharide export system protein LptA
LKAASLAIILSALVATAAMAAAQAQAPATGPRPAREPASSSGAAARPGGSGGGGQNRNAPVTVDADRLEANRKDGLVVFIGNVVAQQDGSTQYADRMEVYLDSAGERIMRTVSTGGVRIITKDCRMGTATRAEYYDEDQRILLIGNARVWQDDNVVTGDLITIYLAEDKSVVESGKQDRVKAVFHPRRDEAGKSGGTRPGTAACR